MGNNDVMRFGALLSALAEYYRKPLSDGVVDLYWQGLREYDYEAIEHAAWAHTKSGDESGRWMPTISDFIKVLAGRSDDHSALAWAKVDRAIRTVGTWDDVVFDDPIIHRVIADMGGWVLLGQKGDDEWPFVGNQFRAAYKGYTVRAKVPEYPKRLLGIANTHNASAGQPLLGVRLLGDEGKAKTVMLSGCEVGKIGLVKQVLIQGDIS